MALHTDFSESPYTIISPSTRKPVETFSAGRIA
jgi:hypothetical protein